MSTSNRLRNALAERKIYKLSSLAKEIGVDESAISRWQNGGAMTIDNASKLCLKLNISMDWLILGRGAMTPEKNLNINEIEFEIIHQLRSTEKSSQYHLAQLLKSLTKISS